MAQANSPPQVLPELTAHGNESAVLSQDCPESDPAINTTGEYADVQSHNSASFLRAVKTVRDFGRTGRGDSNGPDGGCGVGMFLESHGEHGDEVYMSWPETAWDW